jgi:hypothetical protein
LNQPITKDERAEAALVRAAHKGLAYLEQFSQPLLPFQHLRREGYWYQEQLPLDHIVWIVPQHEQAAAGHFNGPWDWR